MDGDEVFTPTTRTPTIHPRADDLFPHTPSRTVWDYYYHHPISIASRFVVVIVVDGGANDDVVGRIPYLNNWGMFYKFTQLLPLADGYRQTTP